MLFWIFNFGLSVFETDIKSADAIILHCVCFIRLLISFLFAFDFLFIFQTDLAGHFRQVFFFLLLRSQWWLFTREKQEQKKYCMKKLHINDTKDTVSNWLRNSQTKAVYQLDGVRNLCNKSMHRFVIFFDCGIFFFYVLRFICVSIDFSRVIFRGRFEVEIVWRAQTCDLNNS